MKLGQTVVMPTGVAGTLVGISPDGEGEVMTPGGYLHRYKLHELTPHEPGMPLKEEHHERAEPKSKTASPKRFRP